MNQFDEEQLERVFFELTLSVTLYDKPYQGFTPVETRILTTIDELIREGEMTKVVTIGEMLGVNSSYISTVTKVLAEHGYLVKEVCAIDGRSVVLALTEKGRKTVGEIKEKRHQEIRQLLRTLGEDDCHTLLNLSSRIRRFLVYNGYLPDTKLPQEVEYVCS